MKVVNIFYPLQNNKDSVFGDLPKIETYKLTRCLVFDWPFDIIVVGAYDY